MAHETRSPVDSKRIKVIHVITRFDKGGSAENTFLTLCGLDRSKYDLALIMGEMEGLNLGGLEQEAVRANLEDAERAGVRIIMVRDLVRSLSPGCDLKAFLSLFRIFRNEKPQIVHTHTSKAGILGRWAAFLCRVPIILHTPHGHVFWGYFGPLETRLYVALEKITALVTKRIVALTDQERDDHLRFRIAPPEKFTTIHSGVDLSRFDAALYDRAKMTAELDIPPGDLVVGTAGRLTPIKGHVHLLEAAAKILAARPDTTFVFLGDGELKASLQEKAASLGVARRVRFPGWRPDVAPVMSAFDVFVLPSLNEGMGRVLVEAMALSRPIVASRTGGINDLVVHEKNGLLVPPRDAGVIADAVLLLLGNEPIRRAMGSEGRRMAQGYSAARMVEKIDALYDQLPARL
jgi:glycosyltransferase involved in cell wall biosynthesis